MTRIVVNTHRFSEALVIFTAGHVKGLDTRREAVQQDWSADLVCHLALRHLGNVLWRIRGEVSNKCGCTKRKEQRKIKRMRVKLKRLT